MIKNVLVSLFAVFLFALGAAGSWYFVQWQEKQKAAKEEQLDLPDNGAAADATSSDADAASTIPTSANGPMPMAVPSGSLTAEQVVRVAGQYRQQVEQLKKREQAVLEQEAQLRLAQQDLDQRKKEIEGILQQIRETADRSEKLLEKLQIERQDLDQKKTEIDKKVEELESAQTLPPAMEQANMKKVARWLQGMGQQEAAAVIKYHANQGEIEKAVKMLSSVEDRDVSKILGEIKDETLVAELFDALTQMRGEDAPPTRR
jgi:flagellar motility protein MotE (MotC chaperone)